MYVSGQVATIKATLVRGQSRDCGPSLSVHDPEKDSLQYLLDIHLVFPCCPHSFQKVSTFLISARVMGAVHMCSCLSVCLYICLRNTALTLACSSPFTHPFSTTPMSPCLLIRIWEKFCLGLPFLGKQREAMGCVGKRLSLMVLQTCKNS